ncbi:MAG TPA: protein kinase [Bryobacteraceae bacterium]|nr:protein kinase [Bryobacteraceae bacterium]
MESERWRRVDDLLQAALERPPVERAEFLRQACAGDEALEREVRSLVASEEAAGGFLLSPAIEVAANAMAQRPDIDLELQTSASLTGQTISHYRIVEKLGEGGMGVVWKARDMRLDRFVALKHLTADRMNDPERKKRFVQEARAASALNHPNIVTIYDIGQEHGTDFIAMEYVPGKALNQLIPRKGMRLNEALKYAIEVADALTAAHAAGIVHRDLKPGNVMVNDSGCVKVLDFGLAKLTEPDGTAESARTETIAEAPKTGEGMIVGTAAYMSPEQAEGRKVDARTDIFSFGALLYEMITGRRAFGGDSMASILSAILRDEPKPASEIAPGLPRALDRIITRCLQKDPSLRYQHAGDLKIDLQQVKGETTAADSAMHQPLPRKLSMGRGRWLAAAVACVVVLLAVGWRLYRPQSALSPWKLTRLTNEAGLSTDSALSPDGKLVVYRSDRAQDGEQDLYVKQVAGGQPIRLTFDGTSTSPKFSPDGSKIVFRSSRDGGGIYEIPAFGGEAQLLARGGLNPVFSPDGSQVAYWVGLPSISHLVPGTGTIWVVPAAGGQPVQVATNFTTARSPIWSPDGKHLLFVGYTSAIAGDSSSIDWWMIGANGEDAVRTDAYEALRHAGLQVSSNTVASPAPGTPPPACWSASENTVIFSIASGDTSNLWAIGISPHTGKVAGAPKRLTTGTGSEVYPDCTFAGDLTFTNVETRRDIWSLSFDLDRGTPEGPLARITEGPARSEWPSFPNSGRYVTFVSDRAGRGNIWMRELGSGKELSVASSSLAQRYPLSNPSGTRVAYSVYEKDQRAVYVSASGGAPEKLCGGCLRATGWSLDEKAILVFGGNPYQIDVLDLATHRQTPLLKHHTDSLLYGRFSPDNRWVSFTVRVPPNRGLIAIAPADGPKPIPESAWITIAETGGDDSADWSPDGKTLYFSSPRDGHSCLWGQRMEARSHRPVGEPFAVQHFHGRVSFRHAGWSVAGGRIGLALVEDTGNIWMMSRSSGR